MLGADPGHVPAPARVPRGQPPLARGSWLQGGAASLVQPHHGTHPSSGTLRLGKDRSVAPLHCGSDNLPAPAGHAWGAPRQQRGEAQHRPRPATTRATSPASAGPCAHRPATLHRSACSTPKPPAVHPTMGRPKCFKRPECRGDPEACPWHCVPPGPSPKPGSPPSCSVARSVPRAGSCHQGEPRAGRMPDGPAAQPLCSQAAFTTPEPTWEQGPGTPRAQGCPTSSPALSGGEMVALGPEPPKRPCPFPPPTVKKLRS